MTRGLARTLVLAAALAAAAPLHSQTPDAQTPDTADFSGGWRTALAAVVERQEWFVPGWVRPFHPPAFARLQGRLLNCLPTYIGAPFPACRERIDWRPAPGLLPESARSELATLDIPQCDSTCALDERSAILALSPPLLPDSVLVRREPRLAGRVVVEIHTLVPGPAQEGIAYGRNVAAVLMRQEGRAWVVEGVHPIQRQRSPAAEVVFPQASLSATVGDTLRPDWIALDGAGREIPYSPNWDAGGSVAHADAFRGVFVATAMGPGRIEVDAGFPPDGFRARIVVNVRERRADSLSAPVVTAALVAEERVPIHEALLRFYCEKSNDEGAVYLDQRIHPFGWHHERLRDPPRQEEELARALVERTCVEGIAEEPVEPPIPYRILALSHPVLEEGEVVVEIVVRGRYREGPRGFWMSNTGFRLARHPDGWRVVKIEPRWIT